MSAHAVCHNPSRTVHDRMAHTRGNLSIRAPCPPGHCLQVRYFVLMYLIVVLPFFFGG
jgi:hypothetical protein